MYYSKTMLNILFLPIAKLSNRGVQWLKRCFVFPITMIVKMFPKVPKNKKNISNTISNICIVLSIRLFILHRVNFVKPPVS